MIAALAASGCVHHHHPPRRVATVHAPGPPPHAPAHGHRHRHHDPGVELVFDGALGVYAVVGRPGYFWHADRYVRWVSGSWYASARLDRAWVVIGSGEVPAKLAAKYGRRAKRSHHRGATGAAFRK
jgi:hypothetical protein